VLGHLERMDTAGEEVEAVVAVEGLMVCRLGSGGEVMLFRRVSGAEVEVEDGAEEEEEVGDQRLKQVQLSITCSVIWRTEPSMIAINVLNE
jgi:hypothetical protein